MSLHRASPVSCCEDYSHLTWMVGLTDEWITDLKALLRQYNPVRPMEASELLV